MMQIIFLRHNRHVFITATLASLALAAGIVHAQTVALVTDVKGKANVQGAAALSIMSEIPVNARVQLDGGAQIVVLYTQSGDEFALSGAALVEFKANAPVTVSGAAPQKRERPLANGAGIRIKTTSSTQAAFVMRNTLRGTPITLVAPVNTRTLETRPEFRWNSSEAKLQYQFELSDDTGKTLYETRTEATQLLLPETVLLRAGAGYTWEVSSRLADGRRYKNAGDFIVAGTELIAQAEALRPAVSMEISSRVAYAAWLDSMELHDAAREYWKALAAERPQDTRLKMLASE